MATIFAFVTRKSDDLDNIPGIPGKRYCNQYVAFSNRHRTRGSGLRSSVLSDIYNFVPIRLQRKDQHCREVRRKAKAYHEYPSSRSYVTASNAYVFGGLRALERVNVGARHLDAEFNTLATLIEVSYRGIELGDRRYQFAHHSGDGRSKFRKARQSEVSNKTADA